MIFFHNDYSEGCHERILQRLAQTNLEQTQGYGLDPYCAGAAWHIRRLCRQPDLGVHFLVGGTQANAAVIAAALRPYQAVVCADSGHINVHETGAVEADGHKILAIPHVNGKLDPIRLDRLCASYLTQEEPEHMVSPAMVYISSPTEWGTVYTRRELEEVRRVCDKWGLKLFLDGARLGYGMASQGNDVSWPELARLCHVFTVGGTKVGALFGEAVVMADLELSRNFRFIIKQQGAMLAKGRMLGLQFDVLLEDGLYGELGRHAVTLADRIRACLDRNGVRQLVPSPSNQIFPILPRAVVQKLQEKYTLMPMEDLEGDRLAVRICTSWATKEENVEQLCADLDKELKIFTI